MDFHAVGDRLQPVKRMAAGFTTFPLQTTLPLFGGLLVDFFHYAFEGLLQARWIVDFEDHLPRRRRKDRPVECESKLASEWRGEIVPQLQSELRLQLAESLAHSRARGVQ